MTIAQRLGQITGGVIKQAGGYGGAHQVQSVDDGGGGGAKYDGPSAEEQDPNYAPEGYVNPNVKNPRSRHYYAANPSAKPSQEYINKMKSDTASMDAGTDKRVVSGITGTGHDVNKPSAQLKQDPHVPQAKPEYAPESSSQPTPAQVSAGAAPKPANIPRANSQGGQGGSAGTGSGGRTQAPGMAAPNTSAATPAAPAGPIQRVKARGFGAGGPIRNLVGARRANVDSGYIQQQRDARQANRQGRQDTRRDKRSASQVLGQLTGQGLKRSR